MKLPRDLRARPNEDAAMAGGKARLPPRWFIKAFWHLHRRVVRASRGRKGLWPPRLGKWGALRLTTTGRRTGEPRSVILGYYDDGPNLVSMAMNGWGAAEPAWWLNLQADPEAVVELAGGLRREVVARPAVGAERERLWQRWRELDENLDRYAARRPRETAVVVFEPRPAAERASGDERPLARLPGECPASLEQTGGIGFPAGRLRDLPDAWPGGHGDDRRESSIRNVDRRLGR